MSITRLMTQPLTVQAVGATTQDAYGDWIPGEIGPAVPVLGYLEQTSSTEFLLNRDTSVTKWKAFLPATTAVTPLSYINFQAQKFQVSGEPHHVYNPRRRSASHIECELVVISG